MFTPGLKCYNITCLIHNQVFGITFKTSEPIYSESILFLCSQAFSCKYNHTVSSVLSYNVYIHVIMQLAATIDLFPTILKLANASIPEDRVIDGIDISSVLFENGQVLINLTHFQYYFTYIHILST